MPQGFAQLGRLANDVAALSAAVEQVGRRPPPTPAPAADALHSAAGRAVVLIQKLVSRADVAQMFATLDQDHDGRVTREELRAGFEAAGVAVSAAELEMVFAAVDKDHNDSISIGQAPQRRPRLPPGVVQQRPAGAAAASGAVLVCGGWRWSWWRLRR